MLVQKGCQTWPVGVKKRPSRNRKGLEYQINSFLLPNYAISDDGGAICQRIYPLQFSPL
jgi:hypothetical protein